MKKKVLALLLIVCITIPLLCLAASHIHTPKVSITRLFSALNASGHKITTTKTTTCKECHRVLNTERSYSSEAHTPITKKTTTYSSINGAYHNIRTTTTISCQKCGYEISKQTKDVVDLHDHPLVSTIHHRDKNCKEEIYKCMCGHTVTVYTPYNFLEPMITPAP